MKNKFRYFLFSIVGLLESKTNQNVLTSKFNNINISLIKNKDITVYAKTILSSDNILQFFDTKISFKIFNKYAFISTKEMKFSASFSKHSPHILQLIFYDSVSNYDNITITSQKINAYINAKNLDENEVIIDPNYKIDYQTFTLGSTNKLILKNGIVTGRTISMQESTFNSTITADQLHSDIKSKQIMLYNLNISLPKFKLNSHIDKIIYKEEHIDINDIELLFDNTKITIKHGFIVKFLEFKEDKTIKISNISTQSKDFEFNAPFGDIDINKKVIVIYDVIIKIKNLTLKVKTCTIDSSLIIYMKDIEIFNNNTDISFSKSGTFSIKDKILNLLDGSVNI